MWNFKGHLWNFTQKFEPIYHAICIYCLLFLRVRYDIFENCDVISLNETGTRLSIFPIVVINCCGSVSRVNVPRYSVICLPWNKVIWKHWGLQKFKYTLSRVSMWMIIPPVIRMQYMGCYQQSARHSLLSFSQRLVPKRVKSSMNGKWSGFAMGHCDNWRHAPFMSLGLYCIVHKQCHKRANLHIYHTCPCAYQWFQGCACKVCETHRLKVKWQKRTAIVTQLCLSQCMTSQWCNRSDHRCNHSDHFITIGHQQ